MFYAATRNMSRYVVFTGSSLQIVQTIGFGLTCKITRKCLQDVVAFIMIISFQGGGGAKDERRNTMLYSQERHAKGYIFWMKILRSRWKLLNWHMPGR